MMAQDYDLTRVDSRPATSGRLICNVIDLNDKTVVLNLVTARIESLSKSDHWCCLRVSGTCYFSASDSILPDCEGWYVICDADLIPLYAGKAGNLNNRLNSQNGSRDNFLNKRRTFDRVRNFVKTFVTNGVISHLNVGVATEAYVIAAMDIKSELPKLDRDNVEKVLQVFRCRVVSEARNLIRKSTV